MFPTATLFLSLSLGAMLAAGVDGKWSGERKFQTPDGEERTMTTTLELKSEGNTLTGKMSAGPRGDVEIQDGKVDGNKVSFTTKISTPRGEFTSNWEGTFSGDEMKLTRQGGPGGGGKRGPAGPITLKRVQ